MRIRVVVLASLLAAGAAQAQSVPSAPPASDSWSKPAPASSAGYRADADSPATEHGQASHFRFKERSSHMALPGNAAREHSGSAGVGTMGTMDRNGRPAVNCPQTPMDPACH